MGGCGNTMIGENEKAEMWIIVNTYKDFKFCKKVQMYWVRNDLAL